MAYMTPEEAKRRVRLLDYDFDATNKWATKAALQDKTLDPAVYQDWRVTERQWNEFYTDVQNRNDWAMLDYGDVESTSKAFEDKMRSMREILGRPNPLDPTKHEDDKDNWWDKIKVPVYVVCATVIVAAVVPKLPSFAGVTFGGDKRTARANRARRRRASLRLRG